MTNPSFVIAGLRALLAVYGNRWSKWTQGDLRDLVFNLPALLASVEERDGLRAEIASLIAAVGEHVTVRSEYLVRAEAAEARYEGLNHNYSAALQSLAKTQGDLNAAEAQLAQAQQRKGWGPSREQLIDAISHSNLEMAAPGFSFEEAAFGLADAILALPDALAPQSGWRPTKTDAYAAFCRWSKNVIKFKGPTAAQEKAFLAGYAYAAQDAETRPAPPLLEGK